jgi:hypothetical protein
MGSRKKRRLREQAARLADPLAPPEAFALDVVAVASAAPAEPQPATAGPFCGECGEGSLHESPARGARERWLALGGSTLYRCESCGARFALAGLSGERRERSHELHFEDRARLYSRQRRRARLWITVLAAAVTFLTVAWLIYRAEQRRLDVEGIPRLP